MGGTGHRITAGFTPHSRGGQVTGQGSNTSFLGHFGEQGGWVVAATNNYTVLPIILISVNNQYSCKCITFKCFNTIILAWSNDINNDNVKKNVIILCIYKVDAIKYLID